MYSCCGGVADLPERSLMIAHQGYLTDGEGGALLLGVRVSSAVSMCCRRDGNPPRRNLFTPYDVRTGLLSAYPNAEADDDK